MWGGSCRHDINSHRALSHTHHKKTKTCTGSAKQPTPPKKKEEEEEEGEEEVWQH